MSTGLVTLASGASTAAIAACVSGDRAASVMPSCTHASVARIPGPPEFVRIAIRLPSGTGCEAKAEA